MTLQFTITPNLLEQVIGAGITIAMLVVLAWTVRKFIGE